MTTISAYDAFVFGVCAGIALVLPIAVVLHFVYRAVTYRDESEINQR